jgi:hypothetical protein
MEVKDVFYLSMTTIVVMVILQVVTYVVVRLMYPPEPKIVYRDRPVYAQAPAPVPLPVVQQNGPVLTEVTQQVKLPEYEPRKPTSDSLRVDPELPAGIQETRPEGT